MSDTDNNQVDVEVESADDTQVEEQQQEKEVDTQEALGELFDEAMDEDFSDDTLEEKFKEITESVQKDDETIDKTESTNDNSDNADDDESEKQQSALDPAQFFKEVTTPFKANGKEVVIDDPEKIQRLMQMGLGYSKQREQINKQLKTIKMLENAGVTDEGQLAYLLDLHSKDPKAIQKFISDIQNSDVEINEYAEGDPDYTANPDEYATDNEIVFEETIARLESVPAFTEVAPILAAWDEKSKAEFMKEPAWLDAFTGYKQSGVFDKIMEVVTEERLVGNLMGLSDLQAFDQVGKTLQAQGAFGTPNVETQSQAATQQGTTEIPQSAKASQTNNNANTQKAAQAAAISQHGSSIQQQSQPKVVNPMELSDEEFEKLYGAELG